jgi:hypothetical protein
MTIADQIIRVKNKVYRFPKKMLSKKPVHMLHIGKTGGTAVKLALDGQLSSGNYSIVLHQHNVKFMDIPRGERVIFFLRDPLNRYVSGFCSRQRQGQPRYISPWNEGEKAAFAYFKTPDQLARALSSQNGEENAKAIFAMKSIGHVKTHYWDWFESPDYCMSRLEDLFFAGFQEQLDEDFDDLRKKLGLPGCATLSTDAVKTHKNPQTIDTALSDEAVENLKEWYSGDYGFISFCRANIRNRQVPGV